MKKTVRIVLDVARQEGLEPVSVVDGSKHVHLRFSNGKDVLMHPVSRMGEPNSRDVSNIRAQFRRFARGQTHGLMVENKRGKD